MGTRPAQETARSKNPCSTSRGRERHPADRPGADGAGAADLEHRLGGGGVAVRAPQRALGRQFAPHAGAAAGEREREVEAHDRPRIAAGQPLDQLVGRAAVAQVDEPPVPHLGRPDGDSAARAPAAPTKSIGDDARYIASPYCSGRAGEAAASSAATGARNVTCTTPGARPISIAPVIVARFMTSGTLIRAASPAR